MARSRVELFEQIRRDWRAGGMSVRELAVRHHVHRWTLAGAPAIAGAKAAPSLGLARARPNAARR
jgi:hypothetical protein